MKVYFSPALLISVTRKGHKWREKENQKEVALEDLEDCVLLDVVSIVADRLITLKKVASIRTITDAIKLHYAEEFGDDCYPTEKVIRAALKRGFIRIELANVAREGEIPWEREE